MAGPAPRRPAGAGALTGCTASAVKCCLVDSTLKLVARRAVASLSSGAFVGAGRHGCSGAAIIDDARATADGAALSVDDKRIGMLAAHAKCEASGARPLREKNRLRLVCVVSSNASCSAGADGAALAAEPSRPVCGESSACHTGNSRTHQRGTVPQWRAPRHGQRSHVRWQRLCQQRSDVSQHRL